MPRILFVLLLVGLMTPCLAQEEPSGQEEESITADEFVAQLPFEKGTIELGDGLATLEVPDNFRYLNPEASRLVLESLWGNPPGSETLGMLFPAEISPADSNGWGVVISYDEDGYVDDDDAAEIDYDELLDTMKEDTVAANEERSEMGYDPIELVGWAEPPHYDSAAHKLYWAKDLRFGGAPENTLNYNIRVLGRRGVLILNAVANTSQLGEIRGDMRDVIAFTNFNEGNRYEDFDPELDKVAAYGIGALVAGKVAAKAGLFKGLIALLLAGKKFLLVALIGLWRLAEEAVHRAIGRADAGGDAELERRIALDAPRTALVVVAAATA